MQELYVEKEQISESYDAKVIKTNLLIAEKGSSFLENCLEYKSGTSFKIGQAFISKF